MYANVVLLGTNVGTASDNSGHYVLTNIAPGNYTIKVMTMGFTSETIDIAVTSQSDMSYSFQLKATSIMGDEVVVSAERQRFEKKVEVGRVNLSLRDIKTAPAFVEADIFRTLQLLPGVTSANDFSSALVVRGGSPDENLIPLDGIEVYNPSHLGGVFSTFNTDAISDAEFLNGGFPAQYGNRISSVLNITTKEGNSKDHKLFDEKGFGKYWDVSQLGGEIGLLSTKLLAEGPLYNGSWMWTVRRTYFDQLARIYYWSKDEPMDWKYYFWDTQGKILYNINQKSRLAFSSFYGRDAINFYFDSGQKASVDFGWDWGNATNSLTWRYVPNSKFLSTMSLANTNYQFDLDVDFRTEDDNGNETTLNIIVFNEINDWTLKEKLDYYATQSHTLSAGFELKQLGMTFIQSVGDQTFLDQNQKPKVASVFLQDRWQIGALLTLQAGLRVSKYSLHDQYYIEPRFGLKYLINKDLAFKAAWGKYDQFLFIINDENSILNIVDFWQPITKDNHAKSLNQYIMGLEQWIGNGWYANLEAYYKPYDNTLTTNPDNDPSIDSDDYIEGTGVVYGAEFLLKKSSGKLNGWIGYSYTKSEKFFDFNSDGRVITSQGEVYTPKYDQPHTLNIVASYTPKEKNTYSVTISTNSGMPYTPVLGYTYTQNSGLGGTSSFFQPYNNLVQINGNRYSARYPAYFRMDVGWNHRFNIKGHPAVFKFQLVNATNHFNTFFYNWNLEEKIVTAVGMFPFLPTFGLEFKF